MLTGESQLGANDSVVALGTCSNKNKKQQMEDTGTILDKFG
jgi:hypothetical protein